MHGSKFHCSDGFGPFWPIVWNKSHVTHRPSVSAEGILSHKQTAKPLQLVMKGHGHWSIKEQARLANQPKPSRSDSNRCNVIFQHGSEPPNSPEKQSQAVCLPSVPSNENQTAEWSFDSVRKTTSLRRCFREQRRGDDTSGVRQHACIMSHL